MKPLTDTAATEAAALVATAAPLFLASIMEPLTTLLTPYVGERQLATIGDALARQNRRRLKLDDVCRIAYVHARSVAENDGYSPYDRIKAYCAKNGFTYDNLHIRVVTDMLLSMEFLKLTAGEDRKGKTCRRYELPPDVRTAIGL